MKELVLYTLLFLSLKYVTANNGDSFKPTMSVRLERCTSYCDPNYCSISTVCRPLNRTSKFVSMDIYFHPGVILESPIYFKLVSYKKFATVYRPNLINVKGELCQELARRTHPLLVVMTDHTISANLLDPCPFTGHRNTKPRVTNIYDYVLPRLPIIPAGEWRLDIALSVKRNGSDVVVVSWSDFYEIKSLTAEEF